MIATAEAFHRHRTEDEVQEAADLERLPDAARQSLAPGDVFCKWIPRIVLSISICCGN